MKEFNLAPIGSDQKKAKKFQKPIYSTSETEEEYQAYLKMKPKWHSKGGHKDSWDPMGIASPPQIVQKPVGVVQKPKPQPQVAQKVERGAEVYPVSLQIFPGNGVNGGHNGGANTAVILENNNLLPPNFERIQKSDSIIEVREKNNMIPAFERIQKSNSVVEVVPIRKLSTQIQQQQSLDESILQQSPKFAHKESSPFIQHKSPIKEASPYLSPTKETQPLSGHQMMKQPDPNKSQSFPVKELSPYDNIVDIERKSSQVAQIPSSASNDNLQVPTSPQDSEDQTTPQAPRKLYGIPKQTSVESTHSFSENDDASEAAQLESALRAIKEDPETTKKKEMHKNLMNEALKKVEMRNIQKKNFSQLARTNPTLAALNIVTRKELKMEELQEKYEQEDQNRQRHKSGSTAKDEQQAAQATQAVPGNSAVNAGVLATFRELSIHKPGPGGSQNSASRQAAIAAKKASTPVKPDATPKQSISKDPLIATSNSELSTADTSAPVVVLRKQPRILEPEELKARTSGTAGASNGGNSSGNALPGNDTVVSALPGAKLAFNNVASVQETKEKAEQIPIKSETTNSKLSPVVKKLENDNLSCRISTSDKDSKTQAKRTSEEAFSQEGGKQLARNQTPSSIQKDERSTSEKALEKINVAKEIVNAQRTENQKSPRSAKQNLEGLVHVKPKQETATKEFIVQEIVSNAESAPKLVRRAAERFEAGLSTEQNNNSPNSSLRVRSKSICNRLRERMEDNKDQESKPGPKQSLPWNGRSSPAVIRRKESMRNNKGYALQMSKSSDSITAAKLMAKARAEGNDGGNSLGINSTFSKSIQKQLDVYTKTKEEIQHILSLAKVGSVNDRISLFSNMMTSHRQQPQADPDQKQEAIRREIEEARAAHEGQETVSDTEIEFQPPIESKVKPLKIPMKPKMINSSSTASNNRTSSSPGGGLRINKSNMNDSPKKDRRPSIEDMPSVKSKIQNYISAASEDTPVDEVKEVQPQMTPKPILRKTSMQEPIQLTPILKRRDLTKERSKSPKKKAPKPVGDQFLSAEQNFKINILSATDMSATEDESENSRTLRNRKPSLKQLEEQPTFLKIPPKQVTESRPGIIKSKSFATPGQFECSIEESAGKKLQMLSFFGNNSSNASTKPATAKPRAASICDEMDDDELVDIDAEFESLLTKTFEKESRKLSLGEKAASISGRGPARSSAGPGGRGVSLDITNTGRTVSFDSASGQTRNRLQKSQSFGFNSSSGASGSGSGSVRGRPGRESQVRGVRERSSSGEDLEPVSQARSERRNSKMSQERSKQSFDPVAALPTSHTKQYSKNFGSPPPHSPSPSQSEYDTCDPWDDY